MHKDSSLHWLHFKVKRSFHWRLHSIGLCYGTILWNNDQSSHINSDTSLNTLTTAITKENCSHNRYQLVSKIVTNGMEKLFPLTKDLQLV